MSFKSGPVVGRASSTEGVTAATVARGISAATEEDRRVYACWYWYLHPQRGCTHSQSPIHQTPRTDPATTGVCKGLERRSHAARVRGPCKARAMAAPGLTSRKQRKKNDEGQRCWIWLESWIGGCMGCTMPACCCDSCGTQTVGVGRRA